MIAYNSVLIILTLFGKTFVTRRIFLATSNAGGSWYEDDRKPDRTMHGALLLPASHAAFKNS